jgi:hypothetical protein
MTRLKNFGSNFCLPFLIKFATIYNGHFENLEIILTNTINIYIQK